MKARRFFVAGTTALAVGILATATAWACVSGPSVTLNPTNAKPGETVTLAMRDFRKADPVEVRWNDLAAPAMATFTHDATGSPFKGTITVPENAQPGNYVLILTQRAPDGKLSQMPVRALLTVTSPNGATPVLGAAVAPAEADRPAGLVRADDDISGGTLALVGLGVAGVGMFLAGMAALLAGRRGQAPAPSRARS